MYEQFLFFIFLHVDEFAQAPWCQKSTNIYSAKNFQVRGKTQRNICEKWITTKFSASTGTCVVSWLKVVNNHPSNMWLGNVTGFWQPFPHDWFVLCRMTVSWTKTNKWGGGTVMWWAPEFFWGGGRGASMVQHDKKLSTIIWATCD